MSGDIRQILDSHHCFLEISPYYVVAEDRPPEGPVSVRRVQAGFDLDIYGLKTSPDPDPPAGYWLVYNRLKEVADVVRREHDRASSIEVIPYGSTIVLDTRNHLQPMALIRIRISHIGDFHQPAGLAEQQALKSFEAQLGALGVTAGRGRT